MKIEKLTEKVYSIKEFKQIADSLQMSVDELCDYPIIYPVKKGDQSEKNIYNETTKGALRQNG